MSKRRIFVVENAAYFFTARIYNGYVLFKREEYALIILEGLRWARENGRIRLYAFVVMPNHLHFVFQPMAGHQVHKICHAFSSFTSHMILKMSRQLEDIQAVNLFKAGGTGKLDRKQQVWQDSLVATVETPIQFEQKIEYVHSNPVRKGWELCADRADYRYSSACYYDYGREPLIKIDDVSKLEEE